MNIDVSPVAHGSSIMAVVPLTLKLNVKDVRGVSIENLCHKQYDLCKEGVLDYSIEDVVIHTTTKGKSRGRHYHPKGDKSKVELFVPVTGLILLLFHENSDPTKCGELLMHPVTEAGKVYRVDPDTCHVVIGITETTTMFSLNNIPYDEKTDNKRCDHGLRFPS